MQKKSLENPWDEYKYLCEEKPECDHVEIVMLEILQTGDVQCLS